MERLLNQLDVWLKRLNEPFLTEKPLLWMQHYPLFLLIAGIGFVLQMLCILFNSEDSLKMSLYMIWTFTLVAVFICFSFQEIFNMETQRFIYYKGQFFPKEEKQVLRTNLVIFLLLFLPVHINTIYQFVKGKPAQVRAFAATSFEYYAAGEYYFLGLEGTPDTQRLSIIRDSVVSRLDTAKYTRYNMEYLAELISETDMSKTGSIVYKYAGVFKNNGWKMEPDQYPQYRRSYSDAVRVLNALNERKPTDVFSMALLLSLGFLCFYLGAAFKYFVGLEPHYYAFREHKPIGYFCLILLAILLLFITFSALFGLTNWGKAHSQQIEYLMEVFVFRACLFVLIGFNLFFWPWFLYVYFYRFPRLKLEILGKAASPR